VQKNLLLETLTMSTRIHDGLTDFERATTASLASSTKAGTGGSKEPQLLDYVRVKVSRSTPQQVKPTPVMWKKHRMRRVSLKAKRCLDLALVLLILPVAAPLLLAVAGIIYAISGGPVLFVHKRVGRDGHEFGCLKFRTMVLNSDAVLRVHLQENPEAQEEWRLTQKLTNDPRVLRGIGSFLRKSSLDELPQLYNVLVGDMSLVGPRPVTRDELDRYGDSVGYYLSMRPGITGHWQVNGRSETTYDERVGMDVQYVQNWTLLADFKILLQTVAVVLAQKGAS
jgi:exopolysaccharide production protein ExoY